MLNDQIISLSFLTISIVLFFVYLWQERKKVYLYRFFALRDQLNRAAIDNKIDEKSVTFLNLSFMLNITIAFSKKFKLSEFVKAMEKEKVKEPSDNQFIEELKKQSPEIIEIAENFFHSFLGLMLINNPILFSIVQILYWLRAIKGLMSMPIPYKDNLTLYNSFKKAELELAA